MANQSGKAIYRSVLTKAVVCGALAGCALASPVMAQNSIAGHFTLKENARFGASVLAAGPYKFSIEPIGTIQSFQSIQQGAGHLVLVVMRPEKSGPSASIFAMASPSDQTREASELILAPDKQETLAQAMYLDKEKLLVDFNWSGPKSKSQVVAQKIEPQQSAAASRTAGNY
jgi:hypothetical protein